MARTGIAALNLIMPGLGLFRLGNWRMGVLFIVAPLVLTVLFTFAMGNLPIGSFGQVIFALVAIVALWLALYIVPTVLTWRGSEFRSPAHGLSRWYGLTAIALLSLLLWQFVTPLAHRFYKPFYLPTESMAPTINKGDKFIADMRWRGPFRRGQMIIFNGPDHVGVSRIAGLPGDRIAMRNGMPIVNEKAAIQVAQGKGFSGYGGTNSTIVFAERLPDEVSTHQVLDLGPSKLDDTQVVRVPPNHLFLLGDNRDNAADSRLPPELGGVGTVLATAVVGRPLFIHWSVDRGKIGQRLDR